MRLSEGMKNTFVAGDERVLDGGMSMRWRGEKKVLVGADESALVGGDENVSVGGMKMHELS